MTDRPFWHAWPAALRWALGASVAVHLFVVLPLAFIEYTPIAMPQAPLSAVLKGPGEVTQAARADDRRLVPVSAGDAAKTSTQQSLKPKPVREDAAAKSSSSAPRPTVAGVYQGEAAVEANAASRPGAVGGAPDAAREGVEADALNRYRLALGAEARKARRYPEASRTRGQEGTCEVFVLLSRNGGVPVVLPGKSSGSVNLDEGALAMVRIATERTPVPPELQGRNLKIPLRIRFSLDDF